MSKIFKRFYLILILMIMAMMILSYSQYRYSYNVIKDEIENIADLSLTNLELEINNWISSNSNVIKNVADFIEADRWTDEDKLFYMTEKLNNNPAFSSIYYGTKDNLMINASGWVPSEGFDLTVRPWYVKAIKKKDLIITDVFLNASQDDMIITIAKPVTNDDQILGVVGGDASVKILVDLVKDYRIGRKGISFLVDSSNQIIAHPNLTRIEELSFTKPTKEYKEAISIMTKEEYGYETINLEGND